jgi:hypothetical protein
MMKNHDNSPAKGPRLAVMTDLVADHLYNKKQMHFV